MLKVIYDNIVFNLQRSGGISVYWKELIDRVINEENVDVSFIEYEGSEENIFRKQLKIPSNMKQLKSSFPNIKINRYFNLANNLSEKVIFHSSYYRTMRGKNIINVVTVHDFTYEKKFKSYRGKIHIFQKKRALENADAIICISENTKKDMIEIYPHLESKIIKVIYNGYNSKDYYYKPDLKPGNNVVFVGARKGYKNFDKCVELMSKTQNIFLNIVGPPLDREEVEFLNKKIPNRYKESTHVSNEELNDIYNNSICLIYLSDYEGFGIPIIEAMSAGCPVIALKKSSIPEVAGNAGLLFDTIEYDLIVNSIYKLRDDRQFREEQVELGLKNSKRFSWESCYEGVISFYQDLYKNVRK
jgi:mannosyltransferase